MGIELSKIAWSFSHAVVLQAYNSQKISCDTWFRPIKRLCYFSSLSRFLLSTYHIVFVDLITFKRTLGIWMFSVLSLATMWQIMYNFQSMVWRLLRIICFSSSGPCGLRFAIEAALCGAYVVVAEKRTSFTRNNVLHLWPYLIHDLRNLGIKKLFGKFCAGSLDHISEWFDWFL